jgi:hypothetical protein
MALAFVVLKQSLVFLLLMILLILLILPIFLSSHILPVLGERTVLYLNLLKFIVSSVEGSEGSLTTEIQNGPLT